MSGTRADRRTDGRAEGVADAVANRFAAAYGAAPEGVWAAPGRVNLIGEHTDYNEGFVLPIALAEKVYVAASLREDGRLRARSVQADDPLEAVVADLTPGVPGGWAGYVEGVVWALGRHGVPVVGADLVIDGRVPLGGGLSSSAAIECAVAAALTDLCGAHLDPIDLALVAQLAENEYVGAPTGLMDQMASVMCTPRHALLIDFRTRDTRQVPFDPAAAGLQLLVIDTGVRHSHAGGEYGDRRRACDDAAALLGVRSLREVEELEPALDRLADATLRRRVRHVVSENARVLRAAAALESGDWAGLGALMTASHASLRDDYEVSSRELDAAVSAALEAGALGARMTGGGFGGSAIALVRGADVPAVTASVADAFTGRGFGAPRVSACRPSEGAGRLR